METRQAIACSQDRYRLLVAILAVFLVVVGLIFGALESFEADRYAWHITNKKPIEGLERRRVQVRTGSAVQVLEVEIARSPAEKALGLMFRTELPMGQGMLFLVGPQDNGSIWMRNTLIPLEALFLSSAGRVIATRADLRPLSERIVSCDCSAAAVLELPAGSLAAYTIDETSIVMWAAN